MTKNIERDKARLLRQEQGLPINDIAKQIGVSLSWVSLWVRDIVRTFAWIIQNGS